MQVGKLQQNVSAVTWMPTRALNASWADLLPNRTRLASMRKFSEISCRCRHGWRNSLAVLIVSVFLSTPALADPAGRIGRIAWLSGPVQLHSASSREAENAVLNRPLTSGDVLSTGAGGRAEIHIGSLKLRVDSGSIVEMPQIDDERVRLRLADGSMIARLPSAETARDFELDTRDGRFSTQDAGHFRFDFDGASSAVTAYSGTLRFDAADSALNILAGQRVQFWNASGTRSRLSAPADDNFANWSRTRDQARTNGDYARHVSPEMTGAEDLDAHGSWSDTPEYGSVWYPRAVAADWAPYRTGRWVWVAPWGWNWVGDEPWGFAPFHYGRWVWHRQAWGWVPGTRIARPVYAPALVAWIGTANFNITISSGVSPTVGWFPLAPREIYVPAYRTSANYVRQVNVTHVTNISNVTTIVNNPQTAIEHAHYAHRAMPRAVTSVPADVVRHHRPVAIAAIQHNERSTLSQHPLHSEAPVAAPAVPAAQAKSTSERHEVPAERERRMMDGPREPQGKPSPLPAVVSTLPVSRAVNPAVTAPIAPIAPTVVQQRTRETTPVREPVPYTATPVVSAPSIQSPQIAQTERRERNERSERPHPAVAPDTRPASMQEAPNRVASAPTQVPVSTPPRIEKPRSETAHQPQVVEVHRQRNEEGVNRRMPHEARPEPVVQAVQQPTVRRAEPVPQRIQEERREPPREIQPSAHQQAPREVSRPPEQRAEARAELRKEQREERRQPPRDEKPQPDTGRPSEDPRKR
jgi:hypothetical protein